MLNDFDLYVHYFCFFFLVCKEIVFCIFQISGRMACHTEFLVDLDSHLAILGKVPINSIFFITNASYLKGSRRTKDDQDMNCYYDKLT